MNQAAQNDMNAILMDVPDVILLRTKSGKTYKAKVSNQFAQGGEGRILTCDEDKSIVLKVYHPTRVPLSEKRFVQLNKLDSKWFIKPKDLLYDGNRVAGFTMDYLSKDYFILQNLMQQGFCKQNGITKEVKIKVVKNMIGAIRSAHALDIVIGDLNQYNIMVNVQGDMKFIDVDSYETKDNAHSGILLDDIRDYYYQGKVSKNSDYFALSVLLFSMICWVHPFKGIHAKYKNIADRMRLKLPIIKVDPELVVPKFYEPLKKGFLLSQFERMYLDKVERFMIDLDEQQVASLIATASLPKPAAVKKYDQKDLHVQEVLTADIMDIQNVGDRLLIKTNEYFYLYDCANKGYVSLLTKYRRSDWDDMYMSDNTMVGVKDNAISIQSKRMGSFVPMNAISISNDAHFHKMENTLFILDADQLFRLNMDNVFGNMMEYYVEKVFGPSFNLFNGFFIRNGDKQLFYHVEKSIIDLLPMPINMVGLYQNKDVGMVSYMEKDVKKKTHRVVHKYFKIEGRKVLLSARDADDTYRFGYQKDPKGGFIFQPQNGYIRIIRMNDFEELSRHALDICTAQSMVVHTSSGIVVWEDDHVWLVNKR